MPESLLSPHYSHYYPNLTIIRGWGPYAYAREGVDGNLERYIDASSQWGVLILGYDHHSIKRAMLNQINIGAVHVCGNNYKHDGQEKLAEVLVARMPKEHEWRVFFTNSGAESIEGAIKLARHHTKKIGLCSLFGSFHGRTTGAMSLGNAALLRKDEFGEMLPGVVSISQDSAEAFKLLEGQACPAKETMAAVFVEPVQGVGGCRMISPLFMREVRDFCDRNQVLMVADEVQSGYGRTGKFWAFEHSVVNGPIIPDIVCAAKPMGGGLPLGAVIAKKEVMTWPAGAHGTTFGGNPVACAAGLELLKIIDDKFLEEVRQKSAWFKNALQRHLSCDVSKVENWNWTVDGLGFMLAINTPSKDFRRKVMDLAYEEKLLVATAEPTAIRLLPPLNISEEVMLQIIYILTRSINKVVQLYQNPQ